PLHALKDGVDGSNGVYVYGSGGVFPNLAFSATNYWVDVVLAPPGSSPPLAAVSGTPQFATLGATFGGVLQARVTDASSNPIAGASMTFTAPSSGASATFHGSNTSVTVKTDSSGIATTPSVVANNTVGGYAVVASVSGISTTATFNLNNVAAGTSFTVFG